MWYEEVANENIDLHGILACESCPLHFKHIPLTYQQLDRGTIRGIAICLEYDTPGAGPE